MKSKDKTYAGFVGYDIKDCSRPITMKDLQKAADILKKQSGVAEKEFKSFEAISKIKKENKNG